MIVTYGFLRSLARLDLAESRIGRFGGAVALGRAERVGAAGQPHDRLVRLESDGRDQAREAEVVADHEQQLDQLALSEPGLHRGHRLLAGGAVDHHFAREGEDRAVLVGELRVVRRGRPRSP